MARDEGFWREFRTIAVPVTAQSVLMALVLVTDQLMVGQLGATAVASVGISAKVTAVLVVALTGLATGVSVFAAQYWGRGQTDRVKHLLGLALAVGGAFAVLITAVVVAFPAVVVAPFTADPAVIADGSVFVRIIGLSYVPTMLTLVCSAVLRSTGVPRLPLVASAVAAVLNLGLDWLMIFGHWGFPQLGLAGAAISTTAARVVEAAVIIGGVYATRHVTAVRSLSELRGASAGLLRSFAVVSLPVALNELLWILGESVYVVVYGRIGTDALAAMAMTFPVQSLAIAVMTGVASATGVLVGQRLGRGDLVDARRRGGQLVGVGIGGAVVVGGLLALVAPWYAGLYDVDGDVQRGGQLCLLVFAAFLWVKVANMVLAGAVLQAGGDSRFVLGVETAATWCVGVPTALVAAFVLHLPVWAVFALLSCEEVVRLLLGWWRLCSGRWVRDLTDEEDGSLEPAS